MKKRLFGATVVALVVIGAATAVAGTVDKPTVIQVGDLVLTINGGITPTTLPAHERVPVGFNATGTLETIDGSHPPAVRESTFEVDRDVEVDVSGLPTCPKQRLLATSTKVAIASCPGALLGRGKASVEVAFPEQPPIDATGPLQLFNGGEKGGVTTFYVHTYVSIPAPTAVVITGRVRRIHDGPYGMQIEAKVPPIAGGAGSLTHFELNANRYVKGTSPRRGFIYARCSDGRILARGIATFSDGTKLSGSVIRTCQKAG